MKHPRKHNPVQVSLIGRVWYICCCCYTIFSESGVLIDKHLELRLPILDWTDTFSHLRLKRHSTTQKKDEMVKVTT